MGIEWIFCVCELNLEEKEALRCLLMYLSGKRQSYFDVDVDNTEDCEKELEVAIDTTLLLICLRINRPLAKSLLRVKNFCEPQLTESILLKFEVIFLMTPDD